MNNSVLILLILFAQNYKVLDVGVIRFDEAAV